MYYSSSAAQASGVRDRYNEDLAAEAEELKQKNRDLRKENRALRKENEALRKENDALRQQLAAAVQGGAEAQQLEQQQQQEEQEGQGQAEEQIGGALVEPLVAEEEEEAEEEQAQEHAAVNMPPARLQVSRIKDVKAFMDDYRAGRFRQYGQQWSLVNGVVVWEAPTFTTLLGQLARFRDNFTPEQVILLFNRILDEYEEAKGRPASDYVAVRNFLRDELKYDLDGLLKRARAAKAREAADMEMAGKMETLSLDAGSANLKACGNCHRVIL